MTAPCGVYRACGVYVTLVLKHHQVCPLLCGLAVGLSTSGVSALSSPEPQPSKCGTTGAFCCSTLERGQL
jgi:hypothetical protein